MQFNWREDQNSSLQTFKAHLILAPISGFPILEEVLIKTDALTVVRMQQQVNIKEIKYILIGYQ